MPEQILTQEEIDALLSAMDRSDVDLQEEKKKKAQAVSYSLTSHNIILRDQFYALEQVFDKFVTLMNQTLSATLQRPVEVQFVGAEMTKYHDFIQEFSAPTSFQIVALQPLIGSALLAIEAGLAFSLIDCMFGGNGASTKTMRDFTMIEQRMLKRISQEVWKGLEQAWTPVHRIQIAYKKTETKPEYVHLLAPDELIVASVFTMKGDEFSGNVHLGIPYFTLEPIKDKLSAKYLQKKETEHTWGSQLKKLLEDTPVMLIAELGRTYKTVGRLLDLRVNDILKLDKGPEDLITIAIDRVPKFLGYPGVIKGNRAVEIAKLLKKNGGKT